MIQIVNWLLTRRCNYKCGYCGLIKNFPDQPKYYPSVEELARNELTTEQVIECLRRFKLHNPNIFIILYGGEPFLYKGIGEVLDYCNKEKIQYTIITNGSEYSRNRLRVLLNNGVIDHLEGLTCSVDPVSPTPGSNPSDIANVDYKTATGIQTLTEFKDVSKDRVAEVTLTTKNLPYAMNLLEFLTSEGIYASITSLDLKFNSAYDFSNIPRRDYNLVLHKDKEVKDFIDEVIRRKDLLIHMRSILPKFYDVLPRNYCWSKSLPQNIHNISIDSDGAFRLCLRIRGYHCATRNVINLLDTKGNIIHPESLKSEIALDRSSLCSGCNWTCRLMSQETIENKEKVPELLHSDLRNG